MTTIHLRLIEEGVRLSASLDVQGNAGHQPYLEIVRPGESYGGYSYEELRSIANNARQMDAEDLRV